MKLREFINELQNLSDNGENDDMEVIDGIFEESIDIVTINDNKIVLL